MDELLDVFMDIGPTAAPQRIAEATRAEVRTTNQRRPRWPMRRFPVMNAYAKLALAAAPLVVIAAVAAINLLPASGRGGVGGPAVSSPLSPAATPSPSASPLPTPPPADALDEALSVDSRHSVALRGISLSFTVPTYGWESHGRPYISRSTQGPQGANVIIYWATFPDGLSADPCGPLLNPSIGLSAADLAAAVSTAPGTELISRPVDTLVGGRPAKHVVVGVRQDLGCDPGFFYTWRDLFGGAFWQTTGVGDTIRVWIVDVGGTRLFIEAATTGQANSRLKKEIQQIVESIRFG